MLLISQRYTALLVYYQLVFINAAYHCHHCCFLNVENTHWCSIDNSFLFSGGIRMTGSILLRQPFWPCWRRQLDGKQRLVNPTSAGANLTSACGTPSIQVLSSSTIFLRNFHDHRLGSCLQPCTFEYHQSILQLQHFVMAFPWDGSCKLHYPWYIIPGCLEGNLFTFKYVVICC